MSSNSRQVDRRHFLQTSATLAAGGLAAPLSAKALAESSLIDTHVYLGRWPLRRLAAETPAELTALLRRANVTQAWVGSFDGLFHKDVHGVNLRLVEACRGAGDGMFIPIGTVNPTLPDWEDDVRRCRETFKMPGIRLHPAYHGYKLDDARFGRLLKLATAAGLFVQLVVKLTKDRHRWLTPAVARVDVRDLFQRAQSPRTSPLILSGASTVNVSPLPVREDASVYFELAASSNDADLKQLLDSVPENRIVLGSAAPLCDRLWKVAPLHDSSKLTRATIAATSVNAQRLVNWSNAN